MTEPIMTPREIEGQVHTVVTVEDRVREVARMREGIGGLKEALKQRDKDYAESTAVLREVIGQHGKDLATAEDALRWLALKRYEQTGEKEVSVGVKIRMETTVSYLHADAIQWARQNPESTGFLKLDATKFNSAARVLDLPFVDKKTLPVAVISRDLSAVLEAS